MNECSESNLWPQMGYSVHLLHRDLRLGAGSKPLPQPCFMPSATCPAPTCLPSSWSPPFFLLIRGLSNDSTVPAILELSLISSAFRNNHHRKTLRAAGMQVGRTSTKQACWQANMCHPFLPQSLRAICSHTQHLFTLFLQTQMPWGLALHLFYFGHTLSFYSFKISIFVISLC